jgi:cation diffusion facilitator CzcD-associated flavoprotein CzcO
MKSTTHGSKKNGSATAHEYDVIIVGAGFSGMYTLYQMRKLGLRARVLEAGTGVGGTWFWNRYPGARCDSDSVEYSYSFSPELEQDWRWTERFATQPEILRYLEHVAERFDLKRDIQLETRVASAAFDETAGRWSVVTEQGEAFTGRFCVMATGCLSSWRVPDIQGQASFAGPTYHTGSWPHEGVDFTGKRVAIIGTGSSGIQSIPVIAKQASHLYVYQRTPNYSVPARNAPLAEEFQSHVRATYPAIRQKARASAGGIGTVDLGTGPAALETAEKERWDVYERAWAKGGAAFLATFRDLLVNDEANHTAAEFVRSKIRETVKDPKTAESLMPFDHPLGTKRICVDSDYYDTFNRPNVTLVNLRESPIESIEPEGVRTKDGVLAVDCLVYATGFDAMTGALSRIDIRGSRGTSLKNKWEHGPRSYLGLMVAGFPNLFTVTGPGSPSVLSNMTTSIEQHVEWITDCVRHMQAEGLTRIEPTVAAEDAWVQHVLDVANTTLYPKAASWYLGANVPGKPRVFMPYVGGVGNYRIQCDAIAKDGYRGFVFAGKKPKPTRRVSKAAAHHHR